MNIYKNGFTYYIERYGPTETDKQLIERSWFIVNYLHNEVSESITELKFEEAIQKSKIWHNMKVLKCKYDLKIMNEINDISQSYYV